MLGGARRAMDQAVKWSQTGYQFGDPLSDKELVRERIAHMAALVYATPPMICMASLTTRHPISEQKTLQTAVSTMMSASLRSSMPVVMKSTASVA